MRIILVRHPKPACQPGLCYGSLDVNCDEADLRLVAARLAPLAQNARVISSPLLRAKRLGKALSPAPDCEPLLRELDFGAWEGRLWSSLGREAIDRWRVGLPDAAPPGGETLAGLAARCQAWLDRLKAEPMEKQILAITHAGPIRVMKALTAGQPLLRYFAEKIPYGSIVTLNISK
jgi:alpha-ribazole phosphatase